MLDKRTWRGKYKGWAQQISNSTQILKIFVNRSRVRNPKGENKKGGAQQISNSTQIFEIFVNMCWIKGPGGENIKGGHNKYHMQHRF